MSFCLIILAGGNSHRFKSNIGKPYQKIAGKSLIEINVIKLLNLNKLKKLFLFITKKTQNELNHLNLKMLN